MHSKLNSVKHTFNWLYLQTQTKRIFYRFFSLVIIPSLFRKLPWYSHLLIIACDGVLWWVHYIMAYMQFGLESQTPIEHKIIILIKRSPACIWLPLPLMFSDLCRISVFSRLKRTVYSCKHGNKNTTFLQASVFKWREKPESNCPIVYGSLGGLLKSNKKH